MADLIPILGTIAAYSAVAGFALLALSAVIVGGFFIALLIGTAGI